MKKAVAFLLCLLAVTLTACGNAAPGRESVPEETSLSHSNAVVSENEHYQIEELGDPFHLQYRIFNQAGQEVMTETVDNHPLRIEMPDGGVLDIQVGYGTGTSRHQYYDIQNDRFSQQFYGVVCFDEDMVAYLENREQENGEHVLVLVIQNAFDSAQFYREFPLDIPAPLGADGPIVQAQFNAGKTEFSMEYYASMKDWQNGVLTSKTISLQE